MKEMIIINEINKIYDPNSLSLIEKWAEEELDSDINCKLVDIHQFFSILSERFMGDD